MKTNELKYVIDKTYKFQANASGYSVDYDIHLRLEHDEVMQLGQEFLESDPEDDDPYCGVGITSDYKDRMDEIAAEELAQSFYQDYLNEREDDEDEDGERSPDDFYDQAYEYLAEYYYGYSWSDEFKQDCINYYQQHK